MPRKNIINGYCVDEFSLDEIQTDFWLNDNSKPMFTAKDMLELSGMVQDMSFHSTGDMYMQISGFISCLADEGERENVWFLKKKELLIFSLGYTLNNSESENTNEEIKSLLKLIKK